MRLIFAVKAERALDADVQQGPGRTGRSSNAAAVAGAPPRQVGSAGTTKHGVQGRPEEVRARARPASVRRDAAGTGGRIGGRIALMPTGLMKTVGNGLTRLGGGQCAGGVDAATTDHLGGVDPRPDDLANHVPMASTAKVSGAP